MTQFEIGALSRSLMIQPLNWGVRDCALDAADIWRAVTGFDPMADLRGTYSTRHGYRLLAMREGGLLAMAKRRLSGAHTFSGDGVGLIRRGGFQHFAVALNGVFAARSPDGPSNVSDGEILGAWSW